MEQVKIPSGHNNLDAVIHRPEKATQKLAILCPGFMDSKDYAHLVHLSNDLADQGYTVVRFDPTGVWDSEGSIEEYTDTQYLKDIKIVLEYMLVESDYRFILLGGHSEGARKSLLYAATDSRISVVLAIMAPSPKSLPLEKRAKWAADGVRITSRDLPGSGEIVPLRIPYSHLQDRDRYNVLDEVGRIHVPILFAAGELDTTVLPEHVKEIFDHANEPKKFVLLKGASHDYRRSLDKVKEVDQIILKELATLSSN